MRPKILTVLAALALAWAAPAQAEDTEYREAAVVCEEVSDVKLFLTLWDGTEADAERAAQAVNRETGRNWACLYDEWRFVDYDYNEVEGFPHEWQLMQMTIVGYMTEFGPAPLLPIVRYFALRRPTVAL